MSNIIDYEYMVCPLCSHRVTMYEYFYLLKDAPCPKCNQGKVEAYLLFTCNPGKYKGVGKVNNV